MMVGRFDEVSRRRSMKFNVDKSNVIVYAGRSVNTLGVFCMNQVQKGQNVKGQ